MRGLWLNGRRRFFRPIPVRQNECVAKAVNCSNSNSNGVQQYYARYYCSVKCRTARKSLQITFGSPRASQERELVVLGSIFRQQRRSLLHLTCINHRRPRFLCVYWWRPSSVLPSVYDVNALTERLGKGPRELREFLFEYRVCYQFLSNNKFYTSPLCPLLAVSALCTQTLAINVS